MTGATAGILGLVTSWGSADFTTALIGGSYNKPASFVLNEKADIHDRTTFVSGGATFGRNIHGLHEWGGKISAHLGTPQIGALGNVTFASGDVLLINEFDIQITAAMHEATVFTGSTVKFKQFVPGLVRATGKFSGYADNATAIAHAGLDAGAAAATFDIVAGGSGKTIGGNILLSDAELSVSPDDINKKSYSFVFDSQVTTAGSGTLLWAVDAGGGTFSLTTPATGKTLTLQSYTSQTYSGTALWKGISIKCGVGSPIMVDIDFQGYGVLTGPTGVS